MTKRTLLGSILGIVILTAGILTFIHFSNDHVECETIVENSVGINGEIITTEKHICNERFNF